MSTRLTETTWIAVAPTLLTSNGTSVGDLSTGSSDNFKVSMVIQLTSLVQPTQNFEIKRIVDDVISLGEVNSPPQNRVNISSFLTTDSAMISALEQGRSRESANVAIRAAFEEEPTIAHRAHLVDKSGCSLGTGANPINVMGGGGGGATPLTYESLLPLLNNANFLNLADVDNISITTVGTVNTLSYQQDGDEVAQLVVDYTDPTTWNMALNAWINDEDGTLLQDDDNTNLNLD